MLRLPRISPAIWGDSCGWDDFSDETDPASFLVASLESRARRGRELRELLHFDGLTGMLNHRTTEELMQQAVARADRTDGELVVVMIDLDHFKQVNDTYGHVTGDRVLVNFSRFLRGRMRKSDVVGRYGVKNSCWYWWIPIWQLPGGG